jgi:hypothetical protein
MPIKRMNQAISILIILFGISLNSFSQEFVKLDSVMIDSLRRTPNSELYIIQEHIIGGCSESIGERNPPETAKSCWIWNKSWIIRFNIKDGLVHQVIDNDCFEFSSYKDDTTNLNIRFKNLFNTTFPNNSNPNFTIEQETSGINSTYPVPCSRFKISKLTLNNTYTIFCNDFIIEMDVSELNTDSIENQTINLLYEFQKRIQELNKLGEKREENWH